MNTNKKIPKGSIIIGFPCIGKTTTSKILKNVIYLESSFYSYNDDVLKNKYNGDPEKSKGDPDRILKENWLPTYVDAIKDNLEKYDYVFTAAFPALTDKLLEENLPIVIVMPTNTIENKNIYNQRSIDRGNLDHWRLGFIKNFSSYIEYNNTHYAGKIPIYELENGKFLIDLLYKK